MFAGLGGWIQRKDSAGLVRAGTIIAVLACTASGYLRGRRQVHFPLPAKPSPAAPDDLWREVQ